jgi:hypothetical protein
VEDVLLADEDDNDADYDDDDDGVVYIDNESLFVPASFGSAVGAKRCVNKGGGGGGDSLPVSSSARAFGR